MTENNDLLYYKFACMSAVLMAVSGYGLYVVKDQINLMQTVSFALFSFILVFSSVIFLFLVFKIFKLIKVVSK